MQLVWRLRTRVGQALNGLHAIHAQHTIVSRYWQSDNKQTC